MHVWLIYTCQQCRISFHIVDKCRENWNWRAMSLILTESLVQLTLTRECGKKVSMPSHSHVPGLLKGHKIHGSRVEWRPCQVTRMIRHNCVWLHQHAVRYLLVTRASSFLSIPQHVHTGHWKRESAHPYSNISQVRHLWQQESNCLASRLATPRMPIKAKLCETEQKVGQSKTGPSRWLNLSAQTTTELLMVMQTLNMHQRNCHQRGYRDLIHCILRLERFLVDQHMQPRYVLQLL